jgi:hypothetical protein
MQSVEQAKASREAQPASTIETVAVDAQCDDQPLGLPFANDAAKNGRNTRLASARPVE